MPVHNHVATVTPPAHSGAGSSTTPNGAVPAGGLGEISRELVATYAPDTAVDTAMATYSVAVQNAGGSQPVPIQSPYLGINFIIALTGIYPSQS
jgi:microcystin-dependent protein